MEIKIDRDELYKSVARVQSILEKKSNMPILSTILLTAEGGLLTASATDLELGYRQEIPAQIVEDGSVTISGRKLFEILKESNKPQILIKKKENDWVYITDGKARFELASQPADEYPTVMEPDEEDLIDLKGEVLADMINKTFYAVSLEDPGYKLSGIFVEKVTRQGRSFLRMVATDGHRLSLIDKQVDNVNALEIGDGIMVPKKGMLELSKMSQDGGNIKFGFKNKTCVAKREKSFLVIRLLDSKFPDYEIVTSRKPNYSINVSKNDIMDGMKHMLILSNERYRAVKIGFHDGLMDLVSANPDLGEAQESIEVSYSGDRIEAAFNPRYFIDVLQCMDSDEVTLNFVDESKPCVIKGEADEGFLGLIMPMKI